jgi:hypothetical protein
MIGSLPQRRIVAPGCAANVNRAGNSVCRNGNRAGSRNASDPLAPQRAASGLVTAIRRRLFVRTSSMSAVPMAATRKTAGMRSVRNGITALSPQRCPVPRRLGLRCRSVLRRNATASDLRRWSSHRPVHTTATPSRSASRPVEPAATPLRRYAATESRYLRQRVLAGFRPATGSLPQRQSREGAAPCVVGAATPRRRPVTFPGPLHKCRHPGRLRPSRTPGPSRDPVLSTLGLAVAHRIVKQRLPISKHIAISQLAQGEGLADD